MNVTGTCPHCSAAYSFDDSQTGQQSHCPTCHYAITLIAPAPAIPPGLKTKPPKMPSATTPARTPKTELEKIRAGTCYGAARSLIGAASALLGIIGAVAIFAALAAPDVGVGAASIGAGLLTIVAAMVIYQSFSVIFDIADTLIAARV